MGRSFKLSDREDVVEAFLTASRALVGVAVRSMAAAPVEVTLAGHRILVLLAERGPQRIGDLSEAMEIHSSNASRHCDRLQRAGLIERRRAEDDGRAVDVSLTPEGRRVVDLVTEARRAEIAAIVDKMPRGREDDLLKALTFFSVAAGEPAEHEWYAARPE